MKIDQAFRLLDEYKVPYPKFFVIENINELKKIKEKIRYPVVIKIISDKIIHKSDVGGIFLNINDFDSLLSSIQKLEELFKDIPERYYLIQEMVRQGIELVVGGIKDKIFGPVVMFGLGGLFVELYRDVSFRLAPISKGDAYDMMDEIKGKKILFGFRNYPPVNREKLADIIVSISKLISSNEYISEIDINPLICYGDEINAVDVRIITRD